MRSRSSSESSFGDALRDFKTPIIIRKIDETIDSTFIELESRIREISSSSDEPIGEDPSKVKVYIGQPEELVADIGEHVKEARNIIRKARKEAPSRSQINELKRALTELEETDQVLLKERAALVADRMRIQYGMLANPSSVKTGEAYLMALAKNLPEPAGSSYKKQTGGRSGSDQTSFRNRLIKAYNTNGSKLLEQPAYAPGNLWCPVSRKEFDPELVTAAHIVPHSVGETNAAYLFGFKPGDGCEVIWSEKNGLMMHKLFEEDFDAAQMLIIPDPTDPDEFISIVLSQDLLNDKTICRAIDAPYSILHKRRLQFQTAARPGKRYLYMRALLSLFWRRRYDVPGWEKDLEQVFDGQPWATLGKWARRSMVEALALEIGDSWEGTDRLGLGGFPDAKSPEEEKNMATMIRCGLEARASDVEEEN